MLNIILLGITSLLTDISSEMVYPILPIYLVTQLGVGPAILGLIEGIAESLSSLLKVFSGYFSDKIKSRKPFAIFGYASSTLGKFFLYISVNWWFVLAGRVIDRFGKGVRTAPRDALIADSAKDKKKGAAFGLHRAMDTLGATIGVFGAYLLITKYKGTFKNIFLFSLIPAFLGVLFLFLVKEKKAQAQSSAVNTRIQFKWQSLDKRLKLFLIFTLIFTLGNSSNQFLLLRAKTLGSPLAQVILFYLVYNIIYGLVAYPASRLSDKIGRKKLLVLGYLFYGLVYLGFAMNKSINNFWLLFGIYGLYIGFTEGVEKALVADIAPPGLRATAIGLHATLVGIGLLPASLLAGMLWKFLGPAWTFYFGSFMGILASIGLWFIPLEKSSNE
ncbi:MAG: MFS transporter [Candidatus Omnitrophica bacterium CG23_combo_of_CG06-09_8_20_14_all_40_11]|nr:MAG: MFS transporter [Candidatus Omnitrophica bacterium CG23_combo_of_CG06-09_8_20_14_all_40_11]